MHDSPRPAQRPAFDPATALARVDHHIAEGRVIIRRQIAVLRQMQQDGLPTRNGLELLAALRDTVEALRRHRRFVLEAMPPASAPSPGPSPDRSPHPNGASAFRQAEGA